jgi:hypothetical protein
MSALNQKQFEKIVAEFKSDCRRAGFQEDWWTAVPGQYDVNVYEYDHEGHPNQMKIIVYPLLDGDATDFQNPIEAGEFDAS